MLSVVAAPVDSLPRGLVALDRAAALAALEARELRLLAFAAGEHLPIELQRELVALELRRAVLAAG